VLEKGPSTFQMSVFQILHCFVHYIELNYPCTILNMELFRTVCRHVGVNMLHCLKWGPSWSWSYGSWIYNYLCNRFLSPQMLGVRLSLRARCTTLCDKVCQWLAAGQWFSLGPAVSSTNKTDRHDITDCHDITEILL